MAVNSTLVSRRMQLSITDGTTADGSAKLKSRTYSNVNPDATAAEIKAVGDALASLMNSDLSAVYYDDKMLLETEE